MIKHLVLGFIVAACINNTLCQTEEDDAIIGETMCRGIPIGMNITQKAVVGNCLKQIGVEKVVLLPKDKISCFGVCVWKGKGLLTTDGKLDHDRILSYVDEIMKPDEVKKPLKDGIEKCFNQFVGTVLDDGDPKCKAYEATGDCVHTIFLKLCHT